MKFATATDTLAKAMEAVERGTEKHGDTAASFRMIAEFWATYISHRFGQDSIPDVEPCDVANMMVLLKIARAAYGQTADNYVDIAGYSSLAAMLSPKEAQEDATVRSNRRSRSR